MENLILVDWDDTLFPTTWTQNTEINLNDVNDVIKELFLTLDNILNNMVIRLLDHGKIRIVSNGSRGWINSCMNVLPIFSQLVELGIINIVSARDLFELDYPKEYTMWKTQAFKICVSEHLVGENVIRQIVSMGDSISEHNALMNLKDWFKSGDINPDEDLENKILKSIIFKKDPELNEVIEQLNKIENMLDTIIGEDESKSYDLINL